MSVSRVRLGAVGYLNARPLVFGLDRSSRFDLRFDLPSECAALLHRGEIDLGTIPSIEYLRGDYRIVPDVAIASRGAVKSVALYTSRPVGRIESIAMDTSSRTSVALVRVLCARAFGIRPSICSRPPNLDSMLAACDAALIIGDNALFLDEAALKSRNIEKIDLGEVWSSMTGLPFVYAFWAGRPGAASAADLQALQDARAGGVARPEELAQQYFASKPERTAIGAAYLRDNIKCFLGDDECAGLELFYRYAAEEGVVESARELRFFV
jgi:chorismate dehydratase